MTGKKIGKKIKFIIVLIMAMLILFPVVLTVTNSFMTTGEIKANYSAILEKEDEAGIRTYKMDRVNLKFIPDKVSLRQYAVVLLLSPDYLYKFWNSVLYTLPIVLIQAMISMGAAYCFTRNRSKAMEILFFCYIILMLIPAQVTLVPNFMLSKWLGTWNTRWAIWLSGFFNPFCVFILTKFARRIPAALFESAEMDGAGEWKVFCYICAPMCKNAAFAVGILVFIDYWNMIEQPIILLKEEALYPLSVFLSRINAKETGIAFAGAVIYMIPAVLLFLYGEEDLVEGIGSTYSIKG